MDDQNSKSRRKSDEMMLPRDSAKSDGREEDTQMYHMGKKYYGPGYGHPANMPPYADIKYYPKGKKYLNNNDYPDTLNEIDEDDASNISNLKRQPSDSMY